MKKLLGGLALAAVLLCMTTVPAAAQLAGNAVYPAMPGVGVTISGDFAISVNDDAKIGTETVKYAGGRVTLGLPMFTVWAGGGVYPLISGFGNETTFGGGAGFNVIKGPLVPVTVSVQGGVGYVKSGGYTTITVPGGVMLAINVPTPGVEVKPWVMPRVELVRTSNGASNSDVGYGASGGLMVTLPMGLGFHATADIFSIKPSGATVRNNPLLVSVGAHYKISVPSLGMM